MSADSSLASSLPAAAALELENDPPSPSNERDDVDGLVHAMSKLRVAVANLATLQRDNYEMAQQLLERETELVYLRSEVERLRSSSPPRLEERDDAALGHLLFVAGAAGYAIEERQGPAPSPGETVELGDARYMVTKLGPSPLPGDSRSCSYLLHAG